MHKLFMILLLLGVISCAWSNAYGRDRRDYYRYTRVHKERCSQNLAHLYNCLKFCADSNNGKLPAADNGAGLMELLRYGALPEHFLCEVAKGKKIRKRSDLVPENIPYVYFGGANLDEALRQCPDMVLAFDKPNTRHCNILLANGTVFELNDRLREMKIKKNRKIETCLDVVEILNYIYKYPPEVLTVLRRKARSMDKAAANGK